MKKLGYIKNIIVIAAVSLFFGSCSENTMDEINKIDNYPLDVHSKISTADLLVSTGFSSVGGDFSSYASIYMEHEVGLTNQFYNAEVRSGGPTAASTMDNIWRTTYSNIKVAKLIIKKCSEGGIEEGSDITLGIAKVMLAYNTALLTDLFGDIPFYEAGELDEAGLPVYRQPKVDKQEVVYQEVFTLLDEAIELFDGEDAGVYGGVGEYDLIYEGDGLLWKKAAYALKARYTMRLLNTYADKNAKLQEVIDLVGKSFSSADEEFKLNIYDGNSQTNPLCALNFSRLPFGVGQSLVDKLLERNDPRFSQMFSQRPFHLHGYKYPVPALVETIDDLVKEDAEDPNDNYNLIAPNGNPIAESNYGYYAILVSDYASTAPTHLISYHELLFLQAEAEARLGNANAEASLKSALVASFENHAKTVLSSYKTGAFQAVPDAVNQPQATAAKYFEDHVKALFTADPVKEVMNQKYLAFVGANGEAVEAYNDYRRMLGLGEDFIKLNNPKDFPLRYVYGTSDATSNPNVKPLVGDGSYVYSEPVWWAGGTR